jgi:L-cysteine/cystine lyase
VTFEEARSAFPVLAHVAYLNAGSSGPLARPTLDAITREQAADGERGRGSRAYYESTLELRERVRAKLAAAVGVAADNVALTTSTTDAVRIVLAGLRLGAGDEIVTTDSEHFGLVGPLRATGARVRAAPVLGRTVDEARDALLAEVTPRTRLFALQHVSWMTGQALPLAAVGEETGIPVLADGAQSAGAIPVEAGRFDFYTVSAQKWLCGPDATGALVVREPEALPVALPSHLSQRRYSPDGSFVPTAGARRFDSGWIGRPALVGLEAALEFHPGWRFERAARATDRCRALLGERFDVLGEPGQGTLVGFRTDGDPAAASARALERGVVIRDIPNTGLLRASCGYWTSDDDLDRLVEALR